VPAPPQRPGLGQGKGEGPSMVDAKERMQAEQPRTDPAPSQLPKSPTRKRPELAPGATDPILLNAEGTRQQERGENRRN